MAAANPPRLLDNARFYVLGASLLAGGLLISWLRISYVQDDVWVIRTQQLFGLLALIYWYVALIITPLSMVFGKQRLSLLLYIRRPIGVVAALFALTHAAFAFWGQLGGFAGYFQLPSVFQWGVLLGLFGLVVLLLMAVTSFDRVITYMTFRRWKWLHRIGYIAAIAVIVHVLLIGTHADITPVIVLSYGALVLLLGLESYRAATLLGRRWPELAGRDYFYTLLFSLWLLGLITFAVLPAAIESYHETKHQSHAQDGHE